MSVVFSQRTMSGFPISIGTSIALEALFDARQSPYDPEKKIDRINVGDYQCIWINIATLMRNLISALPAEQSAKVTENDIIDAILSEIEIITNIFEQEGQGICKPMFFLNDYKMLYTPKFRNVLMRTDNTDSQKLNTKRFLALSNFLLKRSDQIVHTDGLIPQFKDSGSDCLLLSHSSFDLLSAKNFNKLHLLESHSGALKKPAQWNTKLFPMGSNDMSVLPFSSKMLFIFGDRYLIMPQLIGVRRVVYEIAVKRNWSAATTRDKVEFFLDKDVREPMVAKYLKDLPYV